MYSEQHVPANSDQRESGSAKIRRPSQAERSAATRAKVVSAAIMFIYEHGYSSVSNAKVAKAAGVSNGAMTHQYPSHDDLMVAVVRFAYEKFHMDLDKALRKYSSAEALYQIPKILWKLMRAPEGIASLEVVLASRGNATLAKRLKRLADEYDQFGRERMRELLRELMVVSSPEDEKRMAAMEHLMVASIRGLAVESVNRKRGGYPELEIQLLIELFEAQVKN